MKSEFYQIESVPVVLYNHEFQNNILNPLDNQDLLLFQLMSCDDGISVKIVGTRRQKDCEQGCQYSSL